MGENKHTISDLYQMQALPLSAKIRMTERRIQGWIDEYGDDGVYVSFSGGKDSTVLMDIVRNRMGYKNIPAVFVDVPTQYPELKEFALTWDNVEVLKPKISFMQVCEKYGFPFFSKENALYLAEVQHPTPNNSVSIKLRMEGIRSDGTKSNTGKIPEYLKFMVDAPFYVSHECCNVMKKNPLHRYAKETKRNPITAQMADESRVRERRWLKNGCNAFDTKNPMSNPMSFWTEQDILQYIKKNNIPICSVYGDIVEDGQLSGQMCLFENGMGEKLTTTKCKRTGCMLCGFGCHLEKPGEGRFEMLKQTHPKMYALLDVVKNNGVTFREAIDWINEHGNLNIRY